MLVQALRLSLVLAARMRTNHKCRFACIVRASEPLSRVTLLSLRHFFFRQNIRYNNGARRRRASSLKSQESKLACFSQGQHQSSSLLC